MGEYIMVMLLHYEYNEHCWIVTCRIVHINKSLRFNICVLWIQLLAAIRIVHITIRETTTRICFSRTFNLYRVYIVEMSYHHVGWTKWLLMEPVQVSKPSKQINQVNVLKKVENDFLISLDIKYDLLLI